MIAGANRQGTRSPSNGQTVGGTLHRRAHGSTMAGPMWAEAMRAVQDELPDRDVHAAVRAPRATQTLDVQAPT